jgi:hypothetical protein
MASGTPGWADMAEKLPTHRDGWQPNPNPRHPDFEPANLVALTHGAQSERAIEARAAEVHEQLLELAPWCDHPHFLPSVNRYLQAAAREALLHSHIVRLSADKGPGSVPARVWESATAATRLAHTLAGDLGLTPLGEARLRAVAGSAAVTEMSLADLMARGEQAMTDRNAGTPVMPALGTPTPADHEEPTT